MSFFLGIFPNSESVKEIESVAEKLKDVFNGFEISFRWNKPSNYHSTILFLGENLPAYKKFIYQRKLKKFKFKPFNIKLNSVKLGISRKYKELLYIDFLEGGDEMRKLVLQIGEFLKIRNESIFIPHLSLGRVSKDLTEQEHSNICRDLQVVTKKMNIQKIEFRIDEIKLVKSEQGNYEVLMNFKTSSKI